MPNAQIRRSLAGLWAALLALLLICGGLASPASAMATPRLKPPPPGPAYLNKADFDELSAEREAIRRRDWAEARRHAAAVTDPAAKSLGQWLILYADDPDPGFMDIGDFLKTHSGWPGLAKIQISAEKRIPSNAAPDAVLSFFSTRDPLTGDGEVALARAQFAAGERDAATHRVRNAWVNDDFKLSEEQQLVSSYGGLLRPEDHAARVDRLLFEREATAARRVFSRLTSKERRMAEARAALLMRSSKGPALFNALPRDEQLDPGVLLAAVRYYRRTDDEERAVDLARLAPEDPAKLRDPEAWWYERQLLMRWALTEKRYADAYIMAAGHGLESGNAFAEAEFDAGWIALRFLDAPERAETHFQALKGAVGAPISLARAWYWLARTAEAEGQADLASRRYAAAAQFIYTFYGQLAAEKVGAPAATQTFAAPIAPTPEERDRFAARPAVAAMKMLADLQADHELMVFAYYVDDHLDSPGEYVELARLVERRRAPHLAVRAGKVAVARGAFAAEVSYPLIYVPDEATSYAPREVILGLSRQESEFNPRAYSPAGARGVMQIIPSTALSTARKAGLHYNRSALLNDPVYNMIIGSAHLRDLMDRYNGSLIMAFAAYNAGANRVDQWVERYGDPRSQNVDPIDWVEQIPFSETRNYVQRVLENTQVYRGRLTSGPIAGRLAADLEIGGAPERAGRIASPAYALALPPLPERTARLAVASAEDAPPMHTAPGSAALEDIADDAVVADESDQQQEEDTAAAREDISYEAGKDLLHPMQAR